jgi:hypothetical protein
MIEPINSHTPRRRLYFGLGTLLLFVAACAAIFGCFRFGYDRGLASGKQRWFDETPYPVVYNVGDINRLHDGKVDISVYIFTEVKPESWGDVGGQCQHMPLGQDQLIISQTANGHESVKEFLQSVRDGRRVLKPDGVK